MAPNTVVARICASTLAGMCLIWSGSISSFSSTGSLPPVIEATRPTWTPRNLTLALVSITRPDRSEVNVTGTNDFSVPVNNAYVSQMAAISEQQQDQRPPPRVQTLAFSRVGHGAIQPG